MVRSKVRNNPAGYISTEEYGLLIIESQQQQIDKLTSALEFYATRKAYDGDDDLYIDQGKLAQAALKKEAVNERKA